MKVYVLDANALYRFLTGGPGADVVSRLFRESRDAGQNWIPLALPKSGAAKAPRLDADSVEPFGRVLSELWERRGALLNRATVLVIMGDGRNNRRPARADLLREIGRLCRAVIWLIPEERERWGTGDSAIFQYAREVSALVPSRDLRELEGALSKVA